MLSLILAFALGASVAPPAHPPRSPAPAVAPSPSTTDPLRGDWPRPSGKRISLAASLSVNEALERIADTAGWNAVLNTGRAGARTVTLRLRDVAVEDALRAALTGSGLVATRTGDVVVVAEVEEVAPATSVLTGFEEATGRRFTGELDGEDVGDALKQIASQAGLSIVLPPGDLSGSIRGTFKDVPVEDALRAVLSQAGLTAERQGDVLLVRRAGLAAVLPGLGREAQRTAEEALRRAQHAIQESGRQGGDLAEDPGDRQASQDGGRDRNVSGSDLVVHGGERVRDVNVVKGNLQVQGGAAVRNASVVMGRLTLDGGASARDAVAVLGSAKLGPGASAREVVAVLGDVEIGPGAQVERDVVSVGGRLRIDPSARVGGATHAIASPHLPRWPPGFVPPLLPSIPSPFSMVVGTLVRFLVLFVLGLLVLSVMPRRVETVAGAMSSGPLRTVLAGLFGTIGMMILTILLIATVVGILLVPVQALLMVFAGVLGTTALSYQLGRLLPLPASRRTMVVQLAIGTLLFSLVAQIPLLGGMVWVATWFLALGAVLRTRFGQPPGGPAETYEVRAEVHPRG